MVCHFSQNKRRTRIIDEGPESVPQDYPSPWLTETGLVPTDEPSATGLNGQNPLEQPDRPPLQCAHNEIPEPNFSQSVDTVPSHFTSERIYVDEMLEREGVVGKEFHACLIPKVMFSIVSLR